MTSGLPGQVLDQLGAAIVNGEYPPGAVLRTEELERAFAVSRTVAREALRVLEAMRLVTSRRRVGITVQPLAAWNLYDPLVIRWRLACEARADQLRSLSELRSATEPVAAALAARRATPEQAGELTVLAVNLRATAKARDLDAFLVHDIAFHRLVLAASGNEMFTQLGDVVGEVLTGRTHYHLMPEEPQPAAVRLHIEVAEAIAAGAPDRAEAAMRAIVTQAMEEMELGLP
ncbi:FadR/GntR family transcriptional regulator [Actinokineospora iranica]|uniref:DNA-binding transcriptional regulator, FadR family n=1 Tax=Actinokineospora iranica TaxID=1271860 RepID=A0A1G6R0G2_9PSEU|nr:FCD domain-containing protein [Actinokineospora iranica]SDC98160.1 DNA-binding transcriptional regulator, FadR family [Actinokineospora iranica]